MSIVTDYELRLTVDTAGYCLIRRKIITSDRNLQRVIPTLVKTMFNPKRKLAFGTQSVETDNSIRKD